MIDWLMNWWQSWHFAQPDVLWLIVLPIAWLLFSLWRNRGVEQGLSDWQDWHYSQRMSARHSLLTQMQGSSQEVVSKSEGQLKAWQFVFLWLLRLLILVSLISALAQPQSALPPEPQPQQKTVRDLLFVVESSASFLLKDYQQDGQTQTRMQVVKQVLDQFIQQLPGNRFAITVYAESAFNLLPLSSDQRAARLYLQRLRPYLAGRTDEALAEALGLALKQTQDGNLLLADKTTRKRVLVLISDGDNQPGTLPVEQAIDYARQLGVPIYTIGVGSTDKAADKRQYTGLIYQPLKATVLKKIAQQTGGRYFQIGSGQDLQKVLHEIDGLEGVQWQAPPQHQAFLALYPQFLSATLGFFALYLLLLISFKPQAIEEQIS